MSAYTLLRCNPPQIYKEEEEERNKSLISCFYRCTKKGVQAVCLKTLWRREERQQGQAVLKVSLPTLKGSAIRIFPFEQLLCISQICGHCSFKRL